MSTEGEVKSAIDSFGFGTLITVFLPGLALALGIVWVFHGHPIWQSNQQTVLTQFSNMKEWQQTFTAIAVVSLLGSVVAAINGLFESLLYDRVTPCRMKIPPGNCATA